MKPAVVWRRRSVPFSSGRRPIGLSLCESTTPSGRVGPSMPSPPSQSQARLTMQSRFGRKQEALRLLNEWVEEVSRQTAVLDHSTPQILHGAIGVPESRIELELEFNSLSDIEALWNSIPQGFHRTWTTEMQERIVDGSPQWTVFRITTLDTATSETVTKTTADERTVGELREMEEKAVLLGEKESTDSSLLDWKGDAMRVHPGDKLPFRFT